MILNFNITKNEKKEFIKAISEFTGEPAAYMGAPSFAFSIGNLKIDVDRMLIIDENTNTNIIKDLISNLKAKGYICDSSSLIELEKSETFTLESDNIKQSKQFNDELQLPSIISNSDNKIETLPIDSKAPVTIQISDDFNESDFEKLKKLVDVKSNLFKEALDIDNLDFINNGDSITFFWVSSKIPSSELDDNIKVVTQFAEALIKMIQNQKRISSKEKEYTNKKYAMRCFLLRLNFFGDEYSLARKILTSKLSGDGSWLHGKDAYAQNV